MSLDPAQRGAVEARGSVAVVAGAGTGKTHMLARRYLHHLRSGRLRPLEVVAVTFTRRAADELRARIRGVVADALGMGDASVHPDALFEVEAAPIGTIHALAQRICHAFPNEADLPPDVTVLDELDGRLWTAEALDAALDAVHASELAALPFSLLRQALRTLLADPFRAEIALALDAAALRAELDAARERALADGRGSAWAEAVASLRRGAGPSGHPAEVSRRSALDAVAALSARTIDAGEAALAWRTLADLRPSAGRASEWAAGAVGGAGGGLADVKAALRTVRDAARELWQDGRGPAAWQWGPLDERMVERTAAVRTAFARVRADLTERKRRAKVVDFGDLEVHAVRALEHEHVRASLQRRWRAVLVDEYQDTSPAQARLLALLRGDAPVTMVGDEKQSIYAFRGADVGVFRAERERLASDPTAGSIELGTSYRSHAALVGTVNRVFDVVLGADAAPLAAVRATSALPGPHVRWLEIDGDGARGDALALAEAHRIATEIRALLRADPPLTIEDGGVRRALRAGDVAVLARSRASLEALEAVAPAVGVPVLNAGGGDVLGTREGLDALALLAAVVDASDTPSLLAVLRGPFVAASDVAIDLLASVADRGDGRGTRRDAPWWRRLGESADPNLRRGAELLDDLRAAHARGASALELLRMADERSAVGAQLANLPNAARRLADWRGVLDLVEDLEGGAADAFALHRRLRRLRAADVKVPRPPLRSDDAVALLTIHGAKGLEWPVVVVADLARRGRAHTDEVLVDPDLGVTLRWRSGAAPWTEPALFRLAERRARDREAAEDARLAYVALTRARELVILSARAARGGLRSLLGPGLEAAGLVAERSTVDAEAATALPPLPAVPTGVDDADRFWSLRIGQRETREHDVDLPLPPADPFANAPLFAQPAGGDDGGAVADGGRGATWRVAAAVLAVLDEDGAWQNAARVLADAGVAAPRPADLLVTMPGPDGRLVDVVMRWPADRVRRGVALAAPEDLPSGATAAPFDHGEWRWFALDPLAPEAVVAALRRALGGDGATDG